MSTILQFEGHPSRTLNYEVRMLGRQGVLAMSIVANANQFPDIQQRVPSIVDMVAWAPGAAYDDYIEDVDVRANGELDSLITHAPPVAPTDRNAMWWLLLLLPAGALTFWVRRRIVGGLPRAAAPKPS